MARSMLPERLGARWLCALASLATALGAVGPACFSLRAAPAPRGSAARGRLGRERVGAGGPRPREGLGPVLGRAPASAALGALGAGFGVCLARWGRDALRARAALLARGAGRRASSAPAAAAAPAAPAEGAAAPGARFDASLQPGACAPLGEPGVSYWDPAGLATGIDAARFRDYRKAELKHGRVSMLAVLGLIAQHEWRFDLAYPYESPTYNFSNAPSGIGAMQEGPTAPFIGIFVLAAGLVELRASDDGREPGDFGDPLRLGAAWASGYGGEAVPDADGRMWKDFELNHGRLAMVGAVGALLAEYATGLDAVEQWARSGAAVKRTMALLSPQGPVPVPPLSDFL